MSKYPNANVHPEAKIGANVVIEPFATVAKDVVIGDGSWIGPNAILMDGARIGKNCKIFPGAVIAGEPQDLKYKGEPSTAEIGDNTIVREYATINRGTAASGKAKTVVGKNSLVMSYVHIAHDCQVGSQVVLVSYVGLAGEIEVGDWAIIGGGTVAHQFVRFGTHSITSGGSRVSKDVPPYVVAGRTNLSYGGVNKIGLRRRGFTNEQINQITDYYRTIYASGLNVTQAMEELAKQPATPELEVMLDFIKTSKRGIIKDAQGAQADESFEI